MKHLFISLILCLGLISTNSQASWFKDAIDKSKQTINGWFTASEYQLPELTAAELQDYPIHYQFSRIIEPTFKSPFFYLESGSKNMPKVLLVHGLGDAASKDWLKVIPALEEKYHVFAIDLPGFGLSKGQYFEYTPENYSKIIQWFIANKINSKPSLVGHSMGGAISLFYAATYPKTISQLVLVDAAGILERTSYIKQLAEIPDISNDGPTAWSRLNSDIRNFSDKWVEKSGEFYDPTKLLHKNKMLRQVLLQEQGGMNAALAMIDTNYSRLNYQAIPRTNIIWGEKDAIAPLRTGQALIAKLPVAQLNVISGAGHVPMNSHTQQFNQLLLTSLSMPAQTNTSSAMETETNALIPEAELDSSHKESRHGVCKKDDFRKFSGTYESIIINDCKLAELVDVTTNYLSTKDSIVTIIRSEIGNQSSPIKLHSSAVTATDSTFHGKIQTERTRLDFAGVTLHSNESILTASDTTKLVFSISEVVSKKYTGPLHGYYSLPEGSLEQYLIKN